MTGRQHQGVFASVIIPTHNRSAVLQAGLEGLRRQTCAPDGFEVIVVADGCRDDTPEVVRSFEGRLRIRLVETPGLGPAAARNLGAEGASGPLLIFMDDDIEPAPGFVEAHLAAHRPGKGRVVVGYLSPLLESQQGFFRTELLDWWEAMYQKMREPGYQYKYSDLLSGNFSIEASLFREIGKFNPQFRCHEDYELGARLQEARAQFLFSMEAAGFHREGTDVKRSFQRKFEEGIADVQLGRLYPYLKPSFLMVRLQRYALWPTRALQFLAFHWPAAGDRAAALLLWGLDRLDRLRLYVLWKRVLYGLLGYWYWRGVAGELKTYRELKNFLAGVDRRPEQVNTLTIDLAEGIDLAVELLDRHKPDLVLICFNGKEVGCIPYEPGGEKLQGRHLKPALAGKLSVPLLRALAFDASFQFPEASHQLAALCDEHLRTGHPEAKCE